MGTPEQIGFDELDNLEAEEETDVQVLPVDKEFIQEAVKYGKYILPGDEDVDIIIFDKRSDPVPAKEDLDEMELIEVEHSQHFVHTDEICECEVVEVSEKPQTLEVTSDLFEVISVEMPTDVDLALEKHLVVQPECDVTMHVELSEDSPDLSDENIYDNNIEDHITECFEFLEHQVDNSLSEEDISPEQVERNDPKLSRRHLIKLRILAELEEEREAAAMMEEELSSVEAVPIIFEENESPDAEEILVAFDEIKRNSIVPSYLPIQYEPTEMEGIIVDTTVMTMETVQQGTLLLREQLSAVVVESLEIYTENVKYALLIRYSEMKFEESAETSTEMTDTESVILHEKFPVEHITEELSDTEFITIPVIKEESFTWEMLACVEDLSVEEVQPDSEVIADTLVTEKEVEPMAITIQIKDDEQEKVVLENITIEALTLHADELTTEQETAPIEIATKVIPAEAGVLHEEIFVERISVEEEVPNFECFPAELTTEDHLAPTDNSTEIKDEEEYIVHDELFLPHFAVQEDLRYSENVINVLDTGEFTPLVTESEIKCEETPVVHEPVDVEHFAIRRKLPRLHDSAYEFLTGEEEEPPVVIAVGMKYEDLVIVHDDVSIKHIPVEEDISDEEDITVEIIKEEESIPWEMLDSVEQHLAVEEVHPTAEYIVDTLIIEKECMETSIQIKDDDQERVVLENIAIEALILHADKLTTEQETAPIEIATKVIPAEAGVLHEEIVVERISVEEEVPNFECFPAELTTEDHLAPTDNSIEIKDEEEYIVHDELFLPHIAVQEDLRYSENVINVLDTGEFTPLVTESEIKCEETPVVHEPVDVEHFAIRRKLPRLHDSAYEFLTGEEEEPPVVIAVGMKYEDLVIVHDDVSIKHIPVEEDISDEEDITVEIIKEEESIPWEMLDSVEQHLAVEEVHPTAEYIVDTLIIEKECMETSIQIKDDDQERVVLENIAIEALILHADKLTTEQETAPIEIATKVIPAEAGVLHEEIVVERISVEEEVPNFECFPAELTTEDHLAPTDNSIEIKDEEEYIVHDELFLPHIAVQEDLRYSENVINVLDTGEFTPLVTESEIKCEETPVVHEPVDVEHFAIRRKLPRLHDSAYEFLTGEEEEPPVVIAVGMKYEDLVIVHDDVSIKHIPVEEDISDEEDITVEIIKEEESIPWEMLDSVEQHLAVEEVHPTAEYIVDTLIIEKECMETSIQIKDDEQEKVVLENIAIEALILHADKLTTEQETAPIEIATKVIPAETGVLHEEIVVENIVEEEIPHSECLPIEISTGEGLASLQIEPKDEEAVIAYGKVVVEHITDKELRLHMKDAGDELPIENEVLTVDDEVKPVRFSIKTNDEKSIIVHENVVAEYIALEEDFPYSEEVGEELTTGEVKGFVYPTKLGGESILQESVGVEDIAVGEKLPRLDYITYEFPTEEGKEEEPPVVIAVGMKYEDLVIVHDDVSIKHIPVEEEISDEEDITVEIIKEEESIPWEMLDSVERQLAVEEVHPTAEYIVDKLIIEKECMETSIQIKDDDQEKVVLENIAIEALILHADELTTEQETAPIEIATKVMPAEAGVLHEEIVVERISVEEEVPNFECFSAELTREDHLAPTDNSIEIKDEEEYIVHDELFLPHIAVQEDLRYSENVINVLDTGEFTPLVTESEIKCEETPAVHEPVDVEHFAIRRKLPRLHDFAYELPAEEEKVAPVLISYEIKYDDAVIVHDNVALINITVEEETVETDILPVEEEISETEIQPVEETPDSFSFSSIKKDKHSVRVDKTREIELSWQQVPDVESFSVERGMEEHLAPGLSLIEIKDVEPDTVYGSVVMEHISVEELIHVKDTADEFAAVAAPIEIATEVKLAEGVGLYELAVEHIAVEEEITHSEFIPMDLTTGEHPLPTEISIGIKDEEEYFVHEELVEEHISFQEDLPYFEDVVDVLNTGELIPVAIESEIKCEESAVVNEPVYAEHFGVMKKLPRLDGIAYEFLPGEEVAFVLDALEIKYDDAVLVHDEVALKHITVEEETVETDILPVEEEISETQIQPVEEEISETEIQPVEETPVSFSFSSIKKDKYSVRVDKTREIELSWQQVPDVESFSVERSMEEYLAPRRAIIEIKDDEPDLVHESVVVEHISVEELIHVKDIADEFAAVAAPIEIATEVKLAEGVGLYELAVEHIAVEEEITHSEFIPMDLTTGEHPLPTEISIGIKDEEEYFVHEELVEEHISFQEDLPYFEDVVDVLNTGELIPVAIESEIKCEESAVVNEPVYAEHFGVMKKLPRLDGIAYEFLPGEEVAFVLDALEIKYDDAVLVHDEVALKHITVEEETVETDILPVEEEISETQIQPVEETPVSFSFSSIKKDKHRVRVDKTREIELSWQQVPDVESFSVERGMEEHLAPGLSLIEIKDVEPDTVYGSVVMEHISVEELIHVKDTADEFAAVAAPIEIATEVKLAEAVGLYELAVEHIAVEEEITHSEFIPMDLTTGEHPLPTEISIGIKDEEEYFVHEELVEEHISFQEDLPYFEDIVDVLNTGELIPVAIESEIKCEESAVVNEPVYAEHFGVMKKLPRLDGIAYEFLPGEEVAFVLDALEIKYDDAVLVHDEVALKHITVEGETVETDILPVEEEISETQIQPVEETPVSFSFSSIKKDKHSVRVDKTREIELSWQQVPDVESFSVERGMEEHLAPGLSLIEIKDVEPDTVYGSVVMEHISVEELIHVKDTADEFAAVAAPIEIATEVKLAEAVGLYELAVEHIAVEEEITHSEFIPMDLTTGEHPLPTEISIGIKDEEEYFVHEELVEEHISFQEDLPYFEDVVDVLNTGELIPVAIESEIKCEESAVVNEPIYAEHFGVMKKLPRLDGIAYEFLPGEEVAFVLDALEIKYDDAVLVHDEVALKHITVEEETVETDILPVEEEISETQIQPVEETPVSFSFSTIKKDKHSVRVDKTREIELSWHKEPELENSTVDLSAQTPETPVGEYDAQAAPFVYEIEFLPVRESPVPSRYSTKHQHKVRVDKTREIELSWQQVPDVESFSVERGMEEHLAPGLSLIEIKDVEPDTVYGSVVMEHISVEELIHVKDIADEFAAVAAPIEITTEVKLAEGVGLYELAVEHIAVEEEITHSEFIPMDLTTGEHPLPTEISIGIKDEEEYFVHEELVEEHISFQEDLPYFEDVVDVLNTGELIPVAIESEIKCEESAVVNEPVYAEHFGVMKKLPRLDGIAYEFLPGEEVAFVLDALEIKYDDAVLVHDEVALKHITVEEETVETDILPVEEEISETEIQPVEETPVSFSFSSIKKDKHSVRVDKTREIELSWNKLPELETPETPVEEYGVQAAPFVYEIEFLPVGKTPVPSRYSIKKHQHKVRVDKTREIELSWQQVPDVESFSVERGMEEHLAPGLSVIEIKDVEPDTVYGSVVMEHISVEELIHVKDTADEFAAVAAPIEIPTEVKLAETVGLSEVVVEHIAVEEEVILSEIQLVGEIPVPSSSPIIEKDKHSIRVDETRIVELSWQDIPDTSKTLMTDVEETVTDLDQLVYEIQIPPVKQTPLPSSSFISSNKRSIRVDKTREIELSWQDLPDEVISPARGVREGFAEDHGAAVCTYEEMEGLPFFTTRDDISHVTTTDLDGTCISSEDFHAIHQEYIREVERNQSYAIYQSRLQEVGTMTLDLMSNDFSQVTDLDEPIEDFHEGREVERYRTIDVATFEEIENMTYLPAFSTSAEDTSKGYNGETPNTEFTITAMPSTEVQVTEEFIEPKEAVQEYAEKKSVGKMRDVGQWIIDNPSHDTNGSDTVHGSSKIRNSKSLEDISLEDQFTVTRKSRSMYETQTEISETEKKHKPITVEVSGSRSFTPNFDSLYDESYSRPKNLFFMNYKMKSSIESLLSSGSEESPSSVEDEMADDQLHEWYDQPRVSPAPFRERNEIRNHSYRSKSSNSVQRVGPLKSRELITVKPERVAKLIIELQEQLSEDITNFKDFLKATDFPIRMSDEEAFFAYCYLHGRSKWNIVARVNKEGRMVTVKIARKYGNRCSQKSDLSEEEVDNRLYDIASCQVDLPSSSHLSRDAIPYDRLEEDAGILEDFVQTLQRKRSDPVTVAKWFIILNAARQPNIESFLQFDETYFKLTHLSDHEKFIVYALIYGQKQWKVLLEKEGMDIEGVYITFRELPEYLKDYDEMSDREVYRQLTQIALSDDATRKELIKIGFRPPEITHGLPKHLEHWEDNFRRFGKHLNSVHEMEEVFPEIELLSKEDKEILFFYYNNDQNWNIQVKSGRMFYFCSTLFP